MSSLRSPNMDGPYALTYHQRRRTLPSSSSSCVSDFSRFPGLPPPLAPHPPSPPHRSNLPSRSYHYPISLPWTIPPSIPPVNPDTLGLGLSFNGDSDLQARLWALEQQDDPALLQLQLQYDDYDSDSDDESAYDYNYDNDNDSESELEDEDDDHWRRRLGRRVRKLLALRVRVQFVWRKLSL